MPDALRPQTARQSDHAPAAIMCSHHRRRCCIIPPTQASSQIYNGDANTSGQAGGPAVRLSSSTSTLGDRRFAPTPGGRTAPSSAVGAANKECVGTGPGIDNSL